MSKKYKGKRTPSRNSAIKAKEIIRNALDDADDESTPKVSSHKCKDSIVESEGEHYSITSESSNEEKESNIDEDVTFDEQSTISPKVQKGLPAKPKSTPQKKPTAVQIERNKRKLFEVWSDFILTPKSNLRKTSAMNFKWTITSENQKVAICPNEGCDLTFTTRQGLTYHFQRCGVKLNWKCKLCEYVAETQQTLILHHLFNVHKDQLPETPDELTECLLDNRKSRGKRKSRNRSVTETQSIAVEFFQEHYKKRIFENLSPRVDMWLEMNEIETSLYTPETHSSPRFKIDNLTSTDEDWRELKLFESCSTKDAFTCFVGGCVWAASWCPIPLSENDFQYIAVATCREYDQVHSMNCLENERGLIQLWNCGDLHRNSTTENKPYFCLGVAHDYGVIWDMEWCPGGTSWQSPSLTVDTNLLPRLGLLALACGDGIIRILSVPQPKSLSSSAHIYRCEPVIILDPPGTGPAFAYQSTICRCVSWQKTEEQKHIAAGFGNGTVAVWNLTTASPILVVHKTSSQVILRPKESWIAHGAQVNDLKWLPYSNMPLIATVGYDRTLKVWNLSDLIIPRKSIFTKVDWNFKWCGSFASYDDCYANWQASNYVVFKDAGLLNWPTNTLTPHRGCVWVLLFNPLYRIEMQEFNSPDVKITQKKSKKTKSNSEKGFYSINWVVDREKPLQRSYNEITNNFGLIFRDFNGGHKIPDNELNRVRIADNMQYQRLSDFPLVSLTVVQWNPNINSFNWILTAGMAGFLRLSHANAKAKCLEMPKRVVHELASKAHEKMVKFHKECEEAILNSKAKSCEREKQLVNEQQIWSNCVAKDEKVLTACGVDRPKGKKGNKQAKEEHQLDIAKHREECHQSLHLSSDENCKKISAKVKLLAEQIAKHKKEREERLRKAAAAKKLKQERMKMKVECLKSDKEVDKHCQSLSQEDSLDEEKVRKHMYQCKQAMKKSDTKECKALFSHQFTTTIASTGTGATGTATTTSAPTTATTAGVSTTIASATGTTASSG
ncbi:general transcription factor 3C polypeptide 2-like protein [Leptotrombidium deliense]|uniref:General transcription factor 3C polypeptide 2-like protein n=1 Tax=Leptotrombidium deliense TaxID=299467 RepID=A0A443SK99_9ACAR|nr:general transcription factor 3C polypeptide 2-like protein [Leptotrombidium deliense]